MRHFLILVLISLVSACSSSGNNFSVATQYQPATNSTAIGINLFKEYYYTVPPEGRREYNRCVDFALNSMQVGESCKWEVPGSSIGVVKLVQIDANSCHYMFNTMMYKNKQRHWQETACYSHSNNKWIFQNR